MGYLLLRTLCEHGCFCAIKSSSMPFCLSFHAKYTKTIFVLNREFGGNGVSDDWLTMELANNMNEETVAAKTRRFLKKFPVIPFIYLLFNFLEDYPV